MTRQSLITEMKTQLSKIPLLGWLIVGSVFAVVLVYSLIFFIPKQVSFSYAQQTCVSHLTLAPSLQKTHSDDFDVELKNTIRLGGVSLASTKVCLTPKKPLEEGKRVAYVAPFGGVVARKQFSVVVPSAPVAQVSNLTGKSISTAEPVQIELTAEDVIHQYRLAIADKSTHCTQAKGVLSCDVLPLELAPGTTYIAALIQRYKEAEKQVAQGEIATLQPLLLQAPSVTEGQVIYDKPITLEFSFDQPLKEVEASLVRVAGDTVEELKLTIDTDGALLRLSFPELQREAMYRLEITRAIAESGSSLEKPIVTNFQTSGGPKVASVSVGSSNVPRTATITVTLDQPIDASTDIAKVARVEGVSGSVRKKSDTQLSFAIQGGDCTAFKLIIDKGIKSGSNGEVSKDGWSFDARTICGTAWSIGTSVKGRSIMAYSFGSGSKTILFTGGIHGSEPSSTTTMQAWVQYLQANAATVVSTDKRIVIVPNTNPDGIAAGTRYNANNVNVGRNFPTANWSASIETASGTLPNAGGSGPGSEPEAAALINLTRQLKPRLSISFHAQGRLVGANKYGDSVALGDLYARTVGYRTMFYNAEAVMGYPMTGEMEDWMGEELGIPAILIELPTYNGNYLNSQMNALKKMLAS